MGQGPLQRGSCTAFNDDKGNQYVANTASYWVATMKHTTRMATDVAPPDRQRLAEALKPRATARVLVSLIQCDVEGEDRAIAMRREEGLSA